MLRRIGIGIGIVSIPVVVGDGRGLTLTFFQASNGTPYQLSKDLFLGGLRGVWLKLTCQGSGARVGHLWEEQQLILVLCHHERLQMHEVPNQSKNGNSTCQANQGRKGFWYSSDLRHVVVVVAAAAVAHLATQANEL